MMKITKKTVLFASAIGAILLYLFMLPTPIEGNWLSSITGCMCDSHHFLRFEGGKILSMSEHHPPPDWIGTYDRIGWGNYNVNLFLGIGSGVVRPRLFFLDLSGVLKNTWRDFFFWKTRRVLRDPEQNVIRDFGSWNITVRNIDGEAHYYYDGREVDIEGAEFVITLLTREVLTNNTSFVVYTGQEGIPTALRNILEKLDVEHEERPNQLLHRTR